MRITYNIFSNWFNLSVLIVVRFFLTPFLVKTLGNELYGIWVLIEAVIGYIEIANLGLNASIERYTAKYIELKDEENVNSIYSTSFYLFLGLSVFVLLVTIVLARYFSNIFNLNEKYLFLRIIFMLAGVNLAFEFVFYVYSAVLRANQNFLYLNLVTIITFLLRTGVIVILLMKGFKLLAIVNVQITANIIRGILTIALSKRKIKFLKLDRKKISKKTLQRLTTFTFYNFIINLTTKFSTTSSTIIVGLFLSVNDVTYYAIANNLLNYLQNIIRRMQEVLLPRFSQLKARNNSDDIKKSIIIYTKYSLIISIPIILVFMFYGGDFIGIWIGKEYSEISGKILLILAIGRLFQILQQTPISALKGTNRLKNLTIMKMVESLLIIVLSFLLVGKYQLLGVAYAHSIALCLFGLIVIPLNLVTELKISFKDFYIKCIFLNMLLSIPIILLIKMFSFQITDYTSFFTAAAVCIGSFIIVVTLTSKNLITRYLLLQTGIVKPEKF